MKNISFPGFCQIVCFTGSIGHYTLSLQSYSHLVTLLSSLFRLQSAMRDLVDIFGPSSEPAPQPDDPWDTVKSPGVVTSDPWDSVGVCHVTASDPCRLSQFSLCIYCLSVFSQKCTLALLSTVLGCHLLPPPIHPIRGPPTLTHAKAPGM